MVNASCMCATSFLRSDMMMSYHDVMFMSLRYYHEIDLFLNGSNMLLRPVSILCLLPN